MGSRLFDFGTVLTRMKDLVRSGVVKKCPVWVDVVESHPPLTPMAVNVAFQKGKPKQIVYDKDVLMKDYFDQYRRHGETVSLFEDHEQPTVAEKFVEHQMFLLGEKKLTKENKEKTSLETVEHMKEQYRITLLKKDKDYARKETTRRRQELEEKRQEEENLDNQENRS